MGIDSTLSKVLKKITPSDREKKETLEMTKKVGAAVESVIKPLGLGYTLAGSFLRDTWMMDKKEFDVFIMFPEATPRAQEEGA